MNLIYQIGRLDRGFLNLVKFKKDDVIFETCLSSLALKKYLEIQGEKTQLVIIYPISLPLNKTLLGAEFPLELNEAINKCINNPQIYLNNPEEFFKLLNLFQGKEEFILIHSLGTYLGIDFQSVFDDIVLEIFIDLIERYLNLGFDNLYVDISSGHNIYVTAILEALRYFNTWVSLRNSLNSNKVPGIYISFSEPILGNLNVQEYNLFTAKIEYKTFFSSPLTAKDIKKQLAKILTDIFGDDRQLKKGVRELIEKYALVFSAIKNNTPLVIYKYGYHNEKEIKEGIITVLNSAKKKLKESYKNSPVLCKNSYTKTLLALGLYWGIYDILREYEVEQDYQNQGVSLKEIEEKFRKIYEDFNLVVNKNFLGNELKNTAIKTKAALEYPEILEETKKSLAKGDWVSLIEIHQGRKPGNPDKRNYFAHAGFEGNITDIRNGADDFFVCMRDQYIDNIGNTKEVLGLIRNWLYEEI